jgi:hypothetical protein
MAVRVFSKFSSVDPLKATYFVIYCTHYLL